MSYDEYGPLDLTGGLPDARLSGSQRQRTDVRLGSLRVDRVFCINCGSPSGAAFKDTTHIIYLCQDCCDKWGKLPLPEIPEDWVR